MAANELSIGTYTIGSTIGQGSFGKVKLGVHKKTGLNVAIKIINRNKIKDMDVVVKIKREIQNLKLFRHPHIVKLYEVISTPTDIFMFMEFVGGGELFSHLIKNTKLKEDTARKFFQQIISGVDYCHRHMIVHRDLKPENLLLDNSNENVKIADFGLSNMMMDGQFLQSFCGSPNYASPEIIVGKLYAGPEVDIWSCGVLLYALLTGTLPFDGDNTAALNRKIRAGVFFIPRDIPTSAASLIRSMLVVDPLHRATIKHIREHPWFMKNLPEYLFPSANDVDASVVDTDAIRAVCRKLSVSEEEVHCALLGGNTQDQLVIAYNLIIDNRRLDEETAKIPIKDFYFASKVPSHSEKKSENSSSAVLEGSIKPVVKVQQEKGQPLTRKTTPIKQSRWHLGIRSSNEPSLIMQEIFRALKYLGCEWKILNTFHLRVRKRHVVTGRYTKLSLQLYRVDQKNYLLDFMSLDSLDHPDAVRVKRMTRDSMSSSAGPDEDEETVYRRKSQADQQADLLAAVRQIQAAKAAAAELNAAQAAELAAAEPSVKAADRQLLEDSIPEELPANEAEGIPQPAAEPLAKESKPADRQLLEDSIPEELPANETEDSQPAAEQLAKESKPAGKYRVGSTEVDSAAYLSPKRCLADGAVSLVRPVGVDNGVITVSSTIKKRSNGSHQMIEFFELCAGLICALAN